jgi:arylsulfatase A-like enzyme
MKHIVLISIDNLRFDCAGYQPDKKELLKYDVLKYLETPTLDRIAEKSRCFTRCISTNSYTTAAHASMLTGLYPPRHGVRAFYETKLSDEVYTLAEVLKLYGYRTVMMTDTLNLFRPLNLHRGFDHVFHKDDEGLISFLRNAGEEKIFLFVHFFDVHEPFLMSESEAYDNSDYRQELRNLYRIYNLEAHLSPGDSDKSGWRRLVDHLGRKEHARFLPLYVRGVSKFDRGRFGDFMASLEHSGFFADSLLVVCSDHGEGKSSSYDPEGFSHGGMLFDSVIRVPLLLCHPDLSHGTVDRVVSLADVFPTILDMALGPGAADMLPYATDGVSLAGSASGDRAVYSETWQRDNKKLLIPMMFISSFLRQRTVRTGDAKYSITGTPELLAGSGALQQAGDEEFLQKVHRGLFCRFEDDRDYSIALHDIREGLIDREGYLARLRRSPECMAERYYMRYDLREDPYEERPVIADRGGTIQGGETAYFDVITLTSGNGVKTDDIFPGDAETIAGILRNAFGPEWEARAGMMAGNKHLFSCVIDDFINHMRGRNLVYKRKAFEEVLLTSPEFARFLRERITHGPIRSSATKRAIIRHVSRSSIDRVYFLLLRLFPRETLRGRAWQWFLRKVLNS